MLDTTEKFIAQNRQLLTAEEISNTVGHMQLVREAINAQDKDRIQKATEQLNEVSRPYAERIMDIAIKDAMKGKKVI